MAKQPSRQASGEAAALNEQFSDIILILDKKELKLEAVSDIDKNGKAKTVPATAGGEGDFMRIDGNSTVLENFLSNFWRQLKDPSRFNIFRLTANEFKNSHQAIEELKAGKQTPATEEFTKKHEIKSTSENQSINHQNQQEMAKQANNPTPAQGASAEGQTYRFNESMIDWEKLKNFGLSREYLQEKGLLEGMLKGYKTNQTVPVSMNFGSAVLRTDARLSFAQTAGGPVALQIHGIRKTPDLDRPYFGHVFSDEDKKNLRESGNMGRVVELKTRSGEYAPSFISIDKLTNEVVALKAENVFIPDEIKNVKLTEQEKNDLREGKAVYMEGMTANSGKEFNANVQVNADKRGLEFIFNNDKLFNSQSIGGVQLTEKQSQDLNDGKAIFLEDMERKDGEKFSAFVKLDEGSGRPQYTRFNPDSPEGAREIFVPKEMHNVVLTPEDRQQLREGKPVFLENMINRKGEEFSSFVKLDLETGAPQYSRTPDGFGERPDFKIPAEVWGVTLTATQRASLQDGKATLVEGMRGFDGKEFSSYLKVNRNQGKLDYYNENPDRKRDAAQRNVVDQKQDQKQDNNKKKGKGIS